MVSCTEKILCEGRASRARDNRGYSNSIEVDEAIVPAVGFNLGSASSVCGWTTSHLPGKGDPQVEGLRLGKH